MTTCVECRFTEGQERGPRMFCRRYPQTTAVAPGYWCGEFQARKADKKPPEPDKKRGLRNAVSGDCA